MVATTTIRNFVTAACLAATGVMAASMPTSAQTAQSSVFLVIDRYAIDYGLEPYQVPPEVKNDLIAAVGVRDPLPFFSANVGRQFTLRTGTEGNDSWFALNSVPSTWESQAGLNDGLQNFVLAGPGLGSPDRNGERETLLFSIAGMTPVRASNADFLLGRSVCAVIYDDDLSPPAEGFDMSLRGANLGLMAFRVQGVVDTASPWPGMTVELLDVRETCSAPLQTYPEPDEQ